MDRGTLIQRTGTESAARAEVTVLFATESMFVLKLRHPLLVPKIYGWLIMS